MTALMLAVQYGRVECINLLLKKGKAAVGLRDKVIVTDFWCGIFEYKIYRLGKLQ